MHNCADMSVLFVQCDSANIKLLHENDNSHLCKIYYYFIHTIITGIDITQKITDMITQK